MSLLTELDSFTLLFLQICQSYGLCRLRFRRNFDNSPAFQGWDSSRANIQSPIGDGRRFLSSLTGLVNLPDNLPSHKWLGYFRMMSLLRSLGFFNFDFLQICQSYGLRHFASAIIEFHRFFTFLSLFD
jgi:hypothetical protein